MKNFAMILAAALLFGCVSVGQKIDPAKVAGFRQGVTTESEVIASLGPPNSTSLLSDGRRMIGYNHLASRPDAALFIPIVGPFVGKTDVQTGNYFFVFKDGKLDEMSNHVSNMRGGFGGVE